MELFDEQGFAATTVPQITARAGLTTRTFFRHFADKREVIYAGDEIIAFARRLLVEAPHDLDPVSLVEQGLQQVAAERFDGRREEVRRRRALVRTEPSLRERDAQKRDDLAAVMLTAAPGSRYAARLVELVGASDGRAVIKVGQSGPG